jgi:hypothetical protein
MELRCYLPEETRRKRSPLTMPVMVLAVLAIASLFWLLFYRISA